MSANTDVTTSVIHAGSLSPILAHRVEATNGVEMLVPVESSDNVN